MNMKIFQSLHGKQKFKLTNSISMSTTTALSKCNNLSNLLNINLLTKLYTFKQILEQLKSIKNCKKLLKFC